MNDSIKRISLDLHNNGPREIVKVKKIDTGRKIYISLVDGGIPYHISEECRAVFAAKKPDGNTLFNECTIEDCVIIYKLTEQTSAVPGLVNCEIKLYGADDNLITSPKFSIMVDDIVFNEGDEDKIESDFENSALTGLISDTIEAISGANAATTAANSAADAAQAATTLATEATAEANSAADRADDATANAINATSNANTATQEASTAASRAAEIANSILAAKNSGEFDGASVIYCRDALTDNEVNIDFSRFYSTPKTGDLVIAANGSMYLVKLEKTPTQTANLRSLGLNLIGEKGDKGDKGETGETGASVVYCSRNLPSTTSLYTVSLSYFTVTPKKGDLIVAANGNLFTVDSVKEESNYLQAYWLETSIKGPAGEDGADGKDMSPTILTASGIAPFIPDAAERNILSVTVNDDTEVEYLRVLSESIFKNDQGKTVNNIGVTAEWDAENQEFVLNGTTTSPGDLKLITPVKLDWVPGKSYRCIVEHISGNAILASGGSTSYAWSFFRSDNMNSPCRGSTSQSDFQDSYSFTFNLPAIAEGATWTFYFQCWRPGTVFENYRVHVRLFEGNYDYSETVYFDEVLNYELRKGATKIITVPPADITIEYVADTKLYIDRLCSDVQGLDGYSPVRGLDYWTDEDKAEIKSYVDEAILGGAW